MPKPLIYSTSTDGYQNPIQPYKTGWQTVEASSLAGTIQLPVDSIDHFHPTIWSRAVALDRRILRWSQAANDSTFWAVLDQDQELADWLAVHRGLGSWVKFIQQAKLVRQDGGYFLQDWPDALPGIREAVPTNLGVALGLEPGESVPAHYHRVGKAGYLLMGLGIPDKIRNRFRIYHLDFLPLRSGIHQRFDGDLWNQVQQDWYDRERNRLIPFRGEDHKRDIRRSLAASAAELPMLNSLLRWFPEDLAPATGRDPYHSVQLKDGRKLALKLTHAQDWLSWKGNTPAPANVDFLPEGAAQGHQIRWRTAQGEITATVDWINVDALFPKVAADPFNLLPRTLEEAGMDAEDLPSPESQRWGQHAIHYRALSSLACSLEGAEFPKPAISLDKTTLSQDLIFDLEGPQGTERRTLTAAFRRDEDRVAGSVFKLRNRERAMALALFPNFQGEGWKHYWLHVGLWEGAENLDLRPVFAEQVGEPLGLARDSKVIHYFNSGRPLAFELLEEPGRDARGLLLAPPMETYEAPGPQRQLFLAIDLGSSNTTVAYRVGSDETPQLVSFDLRELYNSEPLLFLDNRPSVAAPVGGNPLAANLGRLGPFGLAPGADRRLSEVERHLATTFVDFPRFRTYGQAHGRSVITRVLDHAMAEVRGNLNSPWWFADRNKQLHFPKTEKPALFMKVPTLAGLWSSFQGDVDAFGQLLPLLELPANTRVANQQPVFQQVFGKAKADTGDWKLLTREIKWGGDGRQNQVNNYKRAYLRELKILACAVISRKIQNVFDPDRIPVVLTHPEGMAKELNNLRTGNTLGNANDITLVSESKANHHYFQRWVSSAEKTNPFVFNLLMDMGGGTTDFSLLQRDQLKAYDSLGEVRAGNRIRFVGGQSLLACLARTPLSMGQGESRGAVISGTADGAAQSLSDFLLGYCGPEWTSPPTREGALDRQSQLAMLLESNWERIHPLNNHGIRFKLYLLAYGVAYYGAQIVLHHLRPLVQDDPKIERTIVVRPWLPGSGWRMMRFASGTNHEAWTYKAQFDFMQPIIGRAFAQARKDAHMDRDIDGHHFDIQINDPSDREMCHFEDGIAKASVALGALLPEAGQTKEGSELAVPFGFNFRASSDDGAYPSWRTHAPELNDQAMGVWRDGLLNTYGHGHTIYGENGVDEAWSSMVHPYRPFLDVRERESLGVPRDIQNSLDDGAMKRLKIVHQRALNELRETVSGELSSIAKPPLAIYLQAFLGHLCSPDGVDSARLANDPWY